MAGPRQGDEWRTTISNFMNQKCKYCGQTVKRLMLLAVLEDAGCRVYPSATHCSENQEHEFEEVQP